MRDAVVYGVAEMLRKLDIAESEILKATEKAIKLSMEKTEEHIRTEYQRQTTGKGFTDRTGNLRRSIDSTVVVNAKSDITGYVHAGTSYAVDVECRSSGKFAYLLPGLMDMKAQSWSILTKTLKELF